MAIYSFHAQVISRSEGRSCVASAAYRSGGILYDERTGVTYNYTHKEGPADRAAAPLRPEDFCRRGDDRRFRAASG